MAKYTTQENCIDDAVGWLPITVSCNDDHRKEHEGEAVVDGNETAD